MPPLRRSRDFLLSLQPLFRFLLAHPVLIFLPLRILQSLILRTSLDPDEYFQTLEPAHFAAHQFLGLRDAEKYQQHLTWEWTREKPIRGWIGILPFVVYYCVTHVLSGFGFGVGLHGGVGPRILQAILCQVWIDVAVVWFAERMMILAARARKTEKRKECGHHRDHEEKVDDRTRAFLVFVVAWNWWFAYCGLRTYSNCSETGIAVAVLFLWVSGKKKTPQIVGRGRTLLWLSVAAIGCLVRPTSFIFYVPIGLVELGLVRTSLGAKLRFVVLCCVVGVAAILLGAGVDRIMYGRLRQGDWVWVLRNFAEFNLGIGGENAKENISMSFYGTHAWHWYVSMALPFMLGPVFCVVCFVGFGRLFVFWFRRRDPRWIGVGLVVVFVVAFFSFLPHKEFRFLYLVVPILVSLGSVECCRLWKKYSTWFPRLGLVSALLHLLLFLYFGIVHQRGGPAVMEEILHESSARFASSRDSSFKVLFLMPCHHVPGYAYLHDVVQLPSVELITLDCSPDNKLAFGITEEETFYREPAKFAEDHISSLAPDWIVMYEGCCGGASEELRGVFSRFGYDFRSKVFHGFHVSVIDDRADDHIEIYESKPSPDPG